MRVAGATNGESRQFSKVSCGALMTAMLAGRVLQRNMKGDIALKNTP
jgi:hypothetical protein